MASNTLTWFNSGLGAKTGTTNAALIADIVSMVTANAGNANFSWVIASSSTAGPLYVVLKRKDGSPGRILLVIWASTPAGNNSTILEISPTNNYIYAAYFPNGNVDTPSNLTVASGVIMGDDTNAVKVCTGQQVSALYATNLSPWYFDSAEAVWFGFQSSSSVGSHFAIAAGAIVVDGLDNVYPGVFSTQTCGFNVSFMQWTPNLLSAGDISGSGQFLRTHYNGNNKQFFSFCQTGPWNNTTQGSDVMMDSANSKTWFMPFYLIGKTKGEGPALHLRQIGIGPATTAAFSAYSDAGGVKARQFNSYASGGSGQPWMLNYKI